MTESKSDKEFSDWINSFSDYMKPVEGKLYVIRKPDDINRVHEELERIFGEH